MALSQANLAGPTPTTPTTTTTTAAASAPTFGHSPAAPAPQPTTPPEQIQNHFDHGIWYLLSLWPAMRIACENNWGGPDTLDKRDWLAGAVSDLFVSRPDTDQAELEYFLLQVMMDEFETDVDDDSSEDVARSIMVLRQQLVVDGDVAAFRDLETRWRKRGQMKTDVSLTCPNQDVDGDAEDEEWVDPDGDAEMEDVAPALASAPAVVKEKPKPEMDEDGFTKVVSRKKR